MADPLHKAAVASDHPGAMVNQASAETVRQMTFRHGHANRSGYALAQGPCGRLDTGGMAVFRVAGGIRPPLTEVTDLLHGHGLKAGQVQQGIEQHGAMPGRKNESVAVCPGRTRWVILQELGPKHSGDISHAKGHALVARFRMVNSIHRKDADCVGHGLERRGHFRVPELTK